MDKEHPLCILTVNTILQRGNDNNNINANRQLELFWEIKYLFEPYK